MNKRLNSFLVAACLAAPAGGQAPSPAQAVEELIAADRAFAEASARIDLVTGISAMFAEDVVVPIPRTGFAEGKAAAIETLRANPANLTAKATWTPIRGGISADGLHGFTYGYMTVEQADGRRLPGKYLSYWVKGASGWRVAVYKRTPRPEGEVSLEMRPPSIPAGMVRPVTDPALLARHGKSVDSVERAFSDEAQSIGLSAAFAKYGLEDAMNMGSGPSFTFGASAIAEEVGRGQPPGAGSTLSWAPDKVIVASSGDLGVTIGIIRPNAPPTAGEPALFFPFFTVWKRSSPSGPWRYVAE